MNGFTNPYHICCPRDRRVVSPIAGFIHFRGIIHHPFIRWVKQQVGERGNGFMIEVLPYLCQSDASSILQDFNHRWGQSEIKYLP
jgi:hypothetical protein